jgi:RNA polymerase sigma-70 factor (ECF subfamily)
VAQAGRSESSGALPPDADSGSDTDSDTHSDSNTQLQAVEETHAETWRLVHLAQAGDGEAFGQLYDRYMDVVFRFIYFRVNDRALAEDFTSETFLRALRRIGTISYQGRDIGAWFITIARNIVLDHMKSARHRLEVTTADTLEGKEQAESTEDAVLNVLQSERLMQAIAQLGDEQRECVMLRFLHGLSVSETAHVMGKNDGAIKALQHRAVRKLADLVGGDLR